MILPYLPATAVGWGLLSILVTEFGPAVLGGPIALAHLGFIVGIPLTVPVLFDRMRPAALAVSTVIIAMAVSALAAQALTFVDLMVPTAHLSLATCYSVALGWVLTKIIERSAVQA